LLDRTIFSVEPAASIFSVQGAGEKLNLGDRKSQEDGGNCNMRNLIIYTFHQILSDEMGREYSTHGRDKNRIWNFGPGTLRVGR
jgi:hypothetical protein